MEQNNSTPDTSGGHGTVAPSVNTDTGHATHSTPAVGVSRHGAQETVATDAVGQNLTATEIQKMRDNFSSKITELAQGKSELQKRLEFMEQQQAQRNEQLLRALGGGQPEQPVDMLSTLIDDPDYINRLVSERLKEVESKYEKRFAQQDAAKYIELQKANKDILSQQLSQKFGSEMTNKLVDITDVVDPRIIERNNAIQNDPSLTPMQKAAAEQELYTDIAQALESQGGLEGMVAKKLGKMMMQNPDAVLGDLSRIAQQQRSQTYRQSAMGTYTGGAPVAKEGSSYRSTSVYR